MMNRNIGYILCGFLAVLSTGSCNEIQDEATSEGHTYTYMMRLDGGVDDTYGIASKAAYAWEDGSIVYLQFPKDSYLVQGTAVYNYDDDMWTLETYEELDDTDEGDCIAFHFADAVSSTALKVYLDDHTAIYSDRFATYTLESGEMTVRAALSPMTSRIRFVGSPGEEIELSGITTYSEYNLTLDTFTGHADRKVMMLDENGSSGYVHAVFTDETERELVFYDEGKRAFLRRFSAAVLALGTSGWMSVPTLDSMNGWTVVNSDNMEEITFAEFANVQLLEIKSKSVKLSASVSDCGNGNLLDMGFICATSGTPSFENGVLYRCEPSAELLTRLRGLLPETRYYLKAFMLNERGYTFSDVIRFVTISEEDEGASVHYDEYGGDENWGGNPDVDDGLGYDEYPEDENWGDDPPVEDDLTYDEYPEDENWNR